MGMHVARPAFLGKINVIPSSVSRPSVLPPSTTSSLNNRNTSCSGGWLRLLVQSIFATITVASFILIVIMSVKNPNHRPGLRPTVPPPRCHIQGCRVICHEAPYFEKHEEDIIFAVSEASTKCSRVSLELNTPSFVNNKIPENWLSRMRNNIYQLDINSGNLLHIPPGAFMSQFTGSIEILVLQSIHIKTWESTSFVGLSSLRNLYILNSRIDCVHTHVLRAVDDTLETLTITESGDWDPVNFTGTRGFDKLTTVDFSYNDFNEFLNRRSFVGLEVTKILYLNFCRIKAIGAGAFDHLINVEVLYLNNNMLVTVPPGLFDTIAALDNPRPRISLQDNFWYCDCSVDDLRQLVRKELLLVEATCTYPDEMIYKTFTEFEYGCNNNTAAESYEYTQASNNNNISKTSINSTENKFYPDRIYVNGSYCSNRVGNKTVRLISPVQNELCSSKQFKHLNITQLVDLILENPGQNRTKWLRFSYFIKTNLFSIVQIGAREEQPEEYGLLWYQSTCPHELYCLDVIPSFLRVYNIDFDAHYTFCPINLKTTSIVHENCMDVSPFEDQTPHTDEKVLRIILYITTVLICLCFGAVIVYGLIRRKPTLLKGSKRILFVKHKNVEALVLPPKVPLRSDLTNDIDFTADKEIFTLPSGHKLKPLNLKRKKSVRSDKSSSPSYISAMQPTEDQLAEWRIRHHFNNDLTISSAKSDASTLPWICDSYYYSLDGERTYESLE